jgi:predicted transcriptional regulator
LCKGQVKYLISFPIDTETVFSYLRVMKNITITMPEDLARRVRVLAAEADTSMSQYLCQIAARQVEETNGYQQSMSRYLSRKRGGLKLNRQKLPSRDELHDRDALR